MNLKPVKLIVPVCLLLSFWFYGFCALLEQAGFGEARNSYSQNRTHVQPLFLGTFISPEAVGSSKYVPTTLGCRSFPFRLESLPPQSSWPSNTCFLTFQLSFPFPSLSRLHPPQLCISINIWKETNTLDI